jgi:DNA-binding LytR/AlgR family response regulator
MMPGGMSGLDLAREIRRRRPALPVILTTGYAGAARGAEEEGFPLLLKPYDIEQLQAVLHAHLSADREIQS